MPIRLHDSLTRSIKELRRPNPADPKDVFSFYNCGPTVYGPAHIGNFRTFVINDVLRRLLVLEYGADKVKYVRNLTDVDDKTIKRARDEGRPLADVTKQWTDKFHQDCAALNCLPMEPELEPTATGYIKEQVDMIDVLMKKGNAYRAADGSVYFKVSSFEDYGKLSRVKERELQAGATLKIAAADADEKEDVSDFALWKAHKPDDGANAWDSPWGRGRPGWHIECSAMSKALLGNTIDLHTGGEDLEFPHHENEIAQSECCNGTTFSRHWFHSKHLLVDGKKMSKSLGNLYTLADLREKEGFGQDVGRMLRLALLRAHPRKQMNFTLSGLQEASSFLRAISGFHQRLICESIAASFETNSPDIEFRDSYDALCDDLNVTEAIGQLFVTFNNAKKHALSQPQATKALHQYEKVIFALGIDTQPTRNLSHDVSSLALSAWREGRGASAYSKLTAELLELGWWIDPEGSGFLLRARNSETTAQVIPAAITALADKRWAAKQAKNWAGADALRKELAAAGWSMLDGKEGYKLEPLKKP